MKFEKTFVPYGGYWSTPFVRWQGSLAQAHPVVLAAEVARRALRERAIEPAVFDSLFLGLTVPSAQSFYAAPWAAALVGNPDITGPTIMQACATSARLIGQAAGEVDGDGGDRCILGLVADRRNGGAFQRRYMVTPLEVRGPSGRKVVATIDDDEGITPTTAQGLARLEPVEAGGTVTYGSQTHPADGNCGMVLAGRERARELSRDAGIEVQVLSYAQSRAKRAFMPLAPVPAARRALGDAGLRIYDITAIKTHNPFAVNDVHFSREFDLAFDAFNNHGSSLVYGHPQGPTGMRLVIELIEELVDRGGGYGLFTGCAAGDTGASVVVRVDAARPRR